MSTSIHRSHPFLLAVSSIVFGMSGASAHAAVDWTVTARNWHSTGIEDPHTVPQAGAVLKAGERISTARGQGIELYIGKNRIALDQSTVVIVGDDDPTTEAGTFQLVSGAIDVTVGQGEFVTIDAPRLKTTSKGADFSVTTSDRDSEVAVMSGVVTVLSLANGASTEVVADQVAIVGQKDLNERTGQPDPIILPVAHATVPSPVSAPSDQNNGPWAKARVADPAWMTKLIAEGKATPTWVVKSVAQTSEDPSSGFPPNLPAIGTILDPGMRIATDEKQQVKLTNGLDVMTIRPNSAVVLGNVAADAPEPTFELIQGAIDIKAVDRPANQPLTIGAPHFIATMRDADCVVSMSSAASAVYVKDGELTVSSSASGNTQTVRAGAMAIVRPGQDGSEMPQTILEMR